LAQSTKEKAAFTRTVTRDGQISLLYRARQADSKKQRTKLTKRVARLEKHVERLKAQVEKLHELHEDPKTKTGVLDKEHIAALAQVEALEAAVH